MGMCPDKEEEENGYWSSKLGISARADFFCDIIKLQHHNSQTKHACHLDQQSWQFCEPYLGEQIRMGYISVACVAASEQGWWGS